MKTILKATAVLSMFFATTIVMANKSEIGLRISKESKSLVLSLENPSKDFSVRITDLENNILYFERMENSVVVKKFDLQSLDSGTYFFTTSDLSRTVVYTVAIDGENVEILNKDETVKPHFRAENGHLFINFLNLDKSSVSIKVYDADYRVVFSEKLEQEMIIEKAFNFENAFVGSYRIVLSDKNKTYTENFIVD